MSEYKDNFPLFSLLESFTEELEELEDDVNNENVNSDNIESDNLDSNYEFLTLVLI